MRVLRFQINSEDLLDPSSVRVQCDIKNIDGGPKVLYPISPAHGWFNCVRFLNRGAICDVISQYNRVHQMRSMLKSSSAARDDMTEAFLNEYSKGGTSTK